jgi:hypothetical protein
LLLSKWPEGKVANLLGAKIELKESPLF